MSALPPPQKRLGQNFLIDPNIVRKIVSAAQLKPSDTVLEIGPGRGAMTNALCDAAASVIAVEIDPQLVAHVRQTLLHPRLDLRHEDALVFDYDKLPEHTVVVANLPYYISTPLLFRFLGAHSRISRMILMLQAEVADRIVAVPNSKPYGILSVLTQYRAEPRIAFSVSKQCFRPRPDVDSAVITLTMRPHPSISPSHETLFIRLVRAAFAHRRKTLLNSLRDEGFPAQALVEAFQQTTIDPSRRAETLSIDEFVRLATVLATISPSLL